MRNSQLKKQRKLIRFLQILSKEEIKSFKKWLQSPYHNTNDKLITLYGVLQKYFPDIAAIDLTLGQLYKKLYPTKKDNYNEGTLSNLISEFNKQVRQFLTHDRLKHNRILEQQFLTQAFLEHQESDQFKKLAQEEIGKIEAKETRSKEDYLRLHLLYRQLYRLPGANRRDEQKNLISSDENLDRFYLLGKTQLLAEFSEQEKVMESDHMIDQKLEALESLNLSVEIPGFSAYANFIKWRAEKPFDRFPKFKAQLIEEFQNLSQEDQAILLRYLINDGIRSRRETGNIEYVKDVFYYYKLGMEKDLLLFDGQITENTFSNIIAAGCALKEFDFVEVFIKDYYSKLPFAIRQDAQFWGEINLKIKKREKIQSDQIKILLQRKRDNTNFSIRTMVMILQMQFDDYQYKREENEAIFLDSSHAFERQLSRLKTPLLKATEIQGYKKFVQFSRRLFNLTIEASIDLKKLKKIEEEVEAEPKIPFIVWLRNKIQELKVNL